jgi:aspartate/tyrosine/aromatic aminotransferase
MFENVPVAAPDAIFGLAEDFRQDPNPEKMNLVAGVYQDDNGQTPVFAAVKEAERRILDTESSKSYLPIDGLAEYGGDVRRLLFGNGAEILRDQRAVTVQTPGGTGALRIAGDFLKAIRPEATLHCSDPTWANHPQIFAASGLAYKPYPYLDAETSGLAFERMLAALEDARAGDVVLLHGCCHNPSGVDPSAEQWSEIGDLLVRRELVPLVDFAYQGFATGIEEDATGLRILCRKVPELLISSSFSKNFGLYKERVGALTAVAETTGAAKAVLSQLKREIRANYSNPPAHGAIVVATILADDKLRQSWEAELDGMRQRIRKVRQLLTDGLDARDVRLTPSGNGFITSQNGMFSFSRLDKEQVAALRERFSIYVVGSGRINVAGVTEANLERLCDAVAAVTVG